MSEAEVETFNPALVKQLKLTTGDSLVGYVRRVDPTLKILLLDCPLTIERLTDGTGTTQLILLPWMELVDVTETFAIPLASIMTAHAVTPDMVGTYLTMVNRFRPVQAEPTPDAKFDLGAWVPGDPS
jgi:small nuclear ribonucleoprotein (snRNP)-like protein